MGSCFSCCDQESTGLKNASFETTPTYSLEGTKTNCKILKVYDGDTLWLAIYKHDKIYKYKCRMMNYDSPEMKPPLKQVGRDLEIKAAKASKEYLETLLKDRYVTAEFFGYCKYGRPLVNLYIYNTSKSLCGKDNYTNPQCVNDIMISSKHGYPYTGGKKQEFSKDLD